ncbi:MAG TPA: 4Fe-4S dicluster domain-containing protein [Spirochaetota bacterium]|nr:4Fe-4S dicluster domain-containing protein [Spirochaetota bacterium]
MSDKKPYPVIKEIECKACGRCVAACPVKVLSLGKTLNARGYVFVSYKGEGCTGCGNCFYTCPEPNAIEVHTPGK